MGRKTHHRTDDNLGFYPVYEAWSMSGGTTGRSSELARSAANKLVSGDWPWWADRDKTDPF